jgi:Glycosyltransferase family 92
MTSYLSVCAIYRDEAPYMREWVEFHRLVGVERFFLYDNASGDEHLDVLAPYLADGTVEVDAWPLPPGPECQMPAYNDCLERRREDSRWIAFIDLDEFLFSPTGRPLPDLLSEYAQWPAVGVNRISFGTAGHRKRPDGLVIDSYTRAFDLVASIKSVVDPRRTVKARNPHAFVLADDAGPLVDEHKRPIEGWFTQDYTSELLRINHYYTRSEEEFRHKLAHLRADSGKLREQPRKVERATGTIDDRAITIYAPALRERLAGAAAGDR